MNRQIEQTAMDTEFISTSGRPKYEIFWHTFKGKKSVKFKTPAGKEVVLAPGDVYGAQEFSKTHDIISFPNNKWRFKLEIPKSEKLMERSVLKKNFKVTITPEPVKPAVTVKPPKPTNKPMGTKPVSADKATKAELKALTVEYKQVQAEINKLLIHGEKAGSKKLVALDKRKAKLVERATVLAPGEVEWYLPGATLPKAKVVEPKREVEKTKPAPKTKPADEPVQQVVKPVVAKKPPKPVPVKPVVDKEEDEAALDKKFGNKIVEPLDELDMMIDDDELRDLMNSLSATQKAKQGPFTRKAPKV